MIIDAKSNPRRAGDYAFPGPKKSELNKILQEVYAALAMHWHQKLRPKHFTQGAYSEYGYKPRSQKYNKAKRKKYGHSDPLVYSGYSRNSSAFANITANKNGAQCSMPLVRAFNFTSKKRVDALAEFTRTSKRDMYEYGVLARKLLAKKLRGRNVVIKVNI